MDKDEKDKRFLVIGSFSICVVALTICANVLAAVAAFLTLPAAFGVFSVLENIAPPRVKSKMYAWPIKYHFRALVCSPFVAVLLQMGHMEYKIATIKHPFKELNQFYETRRYFGNWEHTPYYVARYYSDGDIHTKAEEIVSQLKADSWKIVLTDEAAEYVKHENQKDGQSFEGRVYEFEKLTSRLRFSFSDSNNKMSVNLRPITILGFKSIT